MLTQLTLMQINMKKFKLYSSLYKKMVMKHFPGKLNLLYNGIY